MLLSIPLCRWTFREDLTDIGDDRPDPDEEANVADMGVLASDGERARPICIELSPGAVGNGGGGLEARRRAALRSPILTALERNASCIRAFPVETSRIRGFSLETEETDDGGCGSDIGSGRDPVFTNPTSPASAGIGLTPHSSASSKNRLTLANTPLAAFARASISFAASITASSACSTIPLAARAHPTSLDNSTKITFLSLARMENDARTLLSLLRQSVCINADRMAEMTHAVEGWICVFRFEWIADSRRDRD